MLRRGRETSEGLVIPMKKLEFSTLPVDSTLPDKIVDQKVPKYLLFEKFIDTILLLS